MPLSDSQREVLAKLSRSRTAADRQVQRARVLLRAADGAPSTRIAADVGVSATTVMVKTFKLSHDKRSGPGLTSAVSTGRVLRWQ